MAPLIPLPPTELHYCPTVERIKQHTWGSPNQVLVCNKQGRELRGMQASALSNLTAIFCSISSPLCIHKQQVNKSMLCWPDLSCLPPAASELCSTTQLSVCRGEEKEMHPRGCTDSYPGWVAAFTCVYRPGVAVEAQHHRAEIGAAANTDQPVLSTVSSGIVFFQAKQSSTVPSHARPRI